MAKRAPRVLLTREARAQAAGELVVAMMETGANAARYASALNAEVVTVTTQQRLNEYHSARMVSAKYEALLGLESVSTDDELHQLWALLLDSWVFRLSVIALGAVRREIAYREWRTRFNAAVWREAQVFLEKKAWESLRNGWSLAGIDVKEPAPDSPLARGIEKLAWEAPAMRPNWPSPENVAEPWRGYGSILHYLSEEASDYALGMFHEPDPTNRAQPSFAVHLIELGMIPNWFIGVATPIDEIASGVEAVASLAPGVDSVTPFPPVAVAGEKKKVARRYSQSILVAADRLAERGLAGITPPSTLLSVALELRQ